MLETEFVIDLLLYLLSQPFQRLMMFWCTEGFTLKVAFAVDVVTAVVGIATISSAATKIMI